MAAGTWSTLQIKPMFTELVAIVHTAANCNLLCTVYSQVQHLHVHAKALIKPTMAMLGAVYQLTCLQPHEDNPTC